MFGVGLFFAFPALSRLGLTAVGILTCYARQRPKDTCRASNQRRACDSEREFLLG